VTDGWAYRRPPTGDADTRVEHMEPPLAPPPSHWWSDALNDPWRDPHTPVVLSRPVAAPTPPELAEPASAKRSWLLMGVVGVVSALLAGLLGAAVGVKVTSGQGTPVRAMLGAPAVPRPAPDSLAGVASMVLPSVVTVRMAVDGGTALGSGFIVSTDGHVITNDHVVAGGNGMATVIFDDGSTGQAEVVGTDPESDVAVLKVLRPAGLTVARLGDSDYVSVGDQVVAIGSPLALMGTVTAGIVSAVDRPIATGTGNDDMRYYAAIQTDAAVNHGNSGGPLVDAAGQVIGINAVIKSVAGDEASAGNIGLAFAIPINHAQRVATEIIQSGRARRTVIGAELEDSHRGGPVGGVRLRQVVAAGPAAIAGLATGDVVTTYAGRPLSEPADLIALVRKTAPGDSVEVTYKRGPTSHNVLVTLAADPE
jgi:putative serine protease PepD